ncbi:MAG: hypothetical protein ACD_14C00063G0003 [uncultured bacterium]|nr:MAG: hypothetical protein ACD_14C00063G0003 [uncultured bacterium]KKQ45457.1 MAG: hypothetical protein US63_C0016G0008 [Candidatus Moranbacteria bacterium GW2011_GWC2_37_8]KKQ62489.1 MAG: hypothetical protein US82_C0010G0009 [Parcubacteria group bacterium GW2011_GWC1_38_22]
MEDFSRSIEVSKADAKVIPEKIGAWWKGISQQSGTAATPGKLYAVGNYLIELVKNSLGDGKSDGKITANFDGEKIKIVVEDFGSEDKQTNLNVGGNYGFKEIIEYADILEIEANGKLFEKNRKGFVEETDESELFVGSRMTFIKYNVAPPAEEAEETYRGRDFGQRM